MCTQEIVVGNGICEDTANVASCDYDGGDCCLEKIIIGTYACKDCICHLDGTIHQENTGKQKVQF